MKRVAAMSKLTGKFVKAALKSQSVWDLGNKVLYKLCADHPGHGSNEVIIAKTWLIGRAYAAALERRRDADVLGDAFYLKVAQEFRASKIDCWLRDLEPDSGANRQKAIETHKKLTDLLQPITRHANRSFASKYLHFHFPKQFYIYDTRAVESARKLVQLDRGRDRSGDVDAEYADFYTRCEQLSESVTGLLERPLCPREIDKVLLHWNEQNSKKLRNTSR